MTTIHAEYALSRHLAHGVPGVTFAALIMAAMDYARSNGDVPNACRLATAFPLIWDERNRHELPGEAPPAPDLTNITPGGICWSCAAPARTMAGLCPCCGADLETVPPVERATPAAGEAPNPSPTNPIPRAPVMPADFWTMSVCVISTGHITKEDAQVVRALDTFDNSVPDWRHFTNDTHIIRVEQIADFPDPLDDLIPHYSPEFIALCRLAREAGYTHLRLDPDGMTLPGVPSFEW